MSTYFPDIAWRTILNNVVLTAVDYYYDVTVSPVDPNEPGADPMTVDTDCWVVDYAGYTYQVTNVSGSVLTIYDINERSWGDSLIGPTPNMEAYVYKPKNGAFLLTQAQLRYLDKSAPDKIYPVEKGINWSFRGLEIDGLYDDGVNPVAQDSISNITKLSLSPEFILNSEDDGWQGGKKYSLTLGGLLHNTLQDLQGTGVDDNFIHLDQDEYDSLWTKDGDNIIRDSDTSITGISYVNEIKSYTDTLPLIKKDGSNVRISTCILSDCVNDRVGIFTETPLDHLHLTGYARISTLAETANSSLVTSNADGRLIKLPYDNNESKYLRSDGTWAAIITSTGDFLDSVTRMVVDSTFNPGTPSNGDRYIILNAASIHANFGTINKFSDGNALTLGNNDIVQYYSAYSEFRIVYDTSAAMQPATVTVGTDKNGNTNHQWTYNVTDDMWVDRGAAISHNSLDGLNDGGYKHLTAAQYTNFISLTDGSDVSNTLHNHNTQYAIKQSSTTDTTSGRGLIVGAFGLGGKGTTVTSFDDISRNQIYGGTATVLSGERGVITVVGNLGTGGQIAFRGTNDAEIHVRTFYRGGTPSSFFQLYHTGNLPNPIQGSGTANYIPKFTAGATLGNSVMYESAGNVGINHTSPESYLHVRNDGSNLYTLVAGSTVGDTGSVSGIGFSISSTTNRIKSAIGAIATGASWARTDLVFALRTTADSNNVTINDEKMRLTNAGELLINKTSVTSGYMLDVNGAIIATGGNSTNWNTAYTDRFKWNGGISGLDAATGRASLGLGTAATKDVQTSSTASSGVMEVGAFGLGLTANDTTDHLNSIITFMRDSGTATTNVPVGFGYGSIISVPYGTNYNQSLSLSLNGRLFYSWKAGSGNPVNSVQLYTTGNLVNPVTGTGTSGQISYWNGSGSQSGSSNLVWDGTNGRLGIGIASPLEISDIYKNSATQAVTRYVNLTSGVSATDGVLVGIDGNGNGIIWNRNNNFIRLGTNSTERMRITSGGNVLIGTTTDDTTSKLQVNGNVNVNGNIKIGTDTIIESYGTSGVRDMYKFYGYSSTHNLTLSYGRYGLSTTSYIWKIENGGTSRHMGFYNYDDSPFIFMNAASGAVAIGKTSVTSGYRLDINGATAMTGLKVGTLSGLTRMNGGVMEAASITISTSEPSTSGRLNGDIWVES